MNHEVETIWFDDVAMASASVGRPNNPAMVDVVGFVAVEGGPGPR